MKRRGPKVRAETSCKICKAAVTAEGPSTMVYHLIQAFWKKHDNCKEQNHE